jgi:5'-nucleotidase
MADDRQMAQLKLGFPLILGAHDHEPYLEQVDGACIVKTGMDAQNAAIIDVHWPDAESREPTVHVELVRCDDYGANADLAAACARHLQQVTSAASPVALRCSPV